MHLIKQLDKNLLDLAWSLWTELGVAGTQQNHSNVLILLEELVIFTSVISEIDPRLRDESLDWCSKFHHFISLSRMKSLIQDFQSLVEKPFSKYASSLNTLCKTLWPVLTDAHPFRIHLSHKSVLRPHSSPALLNIRTRSIFGTGARADLITFFIVHPNRDFSIAETSEIGYSKRNLAEVLEDLSFGNLFEKSTQGNQQRYRLNENSTLFEMLKPIPEQAPLWRHLFKVLLTLRNCIQRIENYSESTKVVELRNCLEEQRESLQKLRISIPLFENNFSAYLKTFTAWILEWTSLLVKGQKRS